ncbi:DNA recombination protein RmuC [Pelobacter propionicus]|uniref:DNA recombination protein RmuC n=1 Tax=Pelobacter propionicus (strain DSM 2379 / NBRC 103807 / OttBd1) TaxID=338966 RepID=A1AJY2_PELPD|nr:DNA recombination protein RmuC [Pelobacter propionicus]ABK97652.1 protein of unknown function DUF195 [Pelobacter propionicus DSM 2379]
MTTILLFIVLALLAAIVILQILLLKKSSRNDVSSLVPRIDSFSLALDRTERAVREEAARSRDEAGKAAKEQRQELAEAFKSFGGTLMQRTVEAASLQKMQLDTFSNQLSTFSQASGERLDGIRSESATGAKQLREEVIATLKGITESTTTTMGEMANQQKSQLDSMSLAIGKLSESNEKKLEELRTAMEGKLQSMQADNAKQLELMRQTVDEKLQGTLEKRLGESFRQVSERLELVHKGLGEMQVLASGVGDLKKVLSNVKTRGTWGEVQLGALLEQVLTPDQYVANLSTKGGGERVEFAIRLPGQGNDRDEAVWLPIDAKFPVEDYQRLVEAQERGDLDGVEAAGKLLEMRVKACAGDICSKYLNPPRTTDFAILFLPVEGLFAEVIRRTGLTEFIQRECRVVIAGPTTLWSILSSLQMGFRTLAIQKRSSEVWNLLAAVKTEWTKYGDVLESVQKKLHQASETIEKAKTRSRAVGRKLRDVQELPVSEANAILPHSLLADEDAGGGDVGTVG